MIRPMTFAEVASTVKGQWLVSNDDAQCITGICTDSRAVKADECYLPLIGERFDGHEFIESAMQRGATLILTQQPVPALIDVAKESKVAILLVDDTLLALGQLPAFQRQLFNGPLVSVTGSAGKTSVKQLMASVLSVRYNTWMTPGNLNNHIGAPLTLLALTDQHQAAVVELGASALGEIAYIAQFAAPQIGIITNAGNAHLEGFGSVEGIVKTKGELLDYIQVGGTAILNADDTYYPIWQKRAAHLAQLTFGVSESADVRALNICSDLNGSTFDLAYRGQIYPAKIQLVGQHNVLNALAVAAAALGLGFELNDILLGLAQCQPVAGRMQLLLGQNNCRIINDAYNANPASFEAAISSIRDAEHSILVMGDMAEVGPEEIAAHFAIGQFAKQQGIHSLLACGQLSRHAVEAFGHRGQWFDDQSALIQYLKNHVQPTTVVLIKGSRSAGMDVVAHALTVGQED